MGEAGRYRGRGARRSVSVSTASVPVAVPDSRGA